MYTVQTTLSTYLVVGCSIQTVPKQDVDKVRRAIDKPDINWLDGYLCERKGQGMKILNWPTSSVAENSISMMVCFVESTTPTISHSDSEEFSAAFTLPVNKVLGLPVIESKVFAHRGAKETYNFASLNLSTDREVRRIPVTSLNSVSLVKNATGQIVVEVPDEDNLLTLSNMFNETDAEKELVFLNTSVNEGWTSLRLNKVQNDAEVVSYILDQIPVTERAHFLTNVDRLGWNSLHWDCFSDNDDVFVEKMSRLKMEEQAEVASTRTEDGSEWTLLHCAALKNSAQTMETLLNCFPDSSMKWERISCRSKDDTTALHIAVSEGNVKVAIVLLDAAASNRQELLDITDTHGCKAEDYVTTGSLLSDYLNFAKEVRGPLLHEAVIRDDAKMVSFLLGNHPHSSITDIINTKDASGMTVLQIACNYNSVQVLDILLNIFLQDETHLRECLLIYAESGDSALHIAARTNNPAALHRLLKSVSRHDRQELINLKNSDGLQTKHVGQNYPQILDTIKCKCLKVP